MKAYVESLPHSCLLTLHANESKYHSLAGALRWALRSSQRSVWVDCRHITALPAEALSLLRHYATQLWQRGGHLVLCHLPEATRASLAADTSQPLAASLLDASHYGLPCPPSQAPAEG
jgi:anti-anti-sigma regulatory factor